MKQFTFYFRSNILSTETSYVMKQSLRGVGSSFSPHPTNSASKKQCHSLCKATSCTKFAQQQGFCLEHGGGIGSATEPPELKCRTMVKKVFDGYVWRRACDIEHCEKYVVVDDFCVQHYRQVRDQKRLLGIDDVDESTSDVNERKWKRVCTAPGCEKWARKKGLCIRHAREGVKQGQGTPEKNLSNTHSKYGRTYQETTISTNHSECFSSNTISIVFVYN
jgi:hypothetical protein